MHSLDLRYHPWIMRSFLRFLLWLSITVLSFQGSAAMAIGELGAPAHGAMIMTASQHHESAGHTVKQADEDHCGKAGAKVLAPHAKCAMCASCCVGTAAPPFLLPTVHALPSTSLLHPVAQAAMTSVFPSVLERPPRPAFV
jgi:hypothetical protein